MFKNLIKRGKDGEFIMACSPKSSSVVKVHRECVVAWRIQDQNYIREHEDLGIEWHAATLNDFIVVP